LLIAGGWRLVPRTPEAPSSAARVSGQYIEWDASVCSGVCVKCEIVTGGAGTSMND